MSLLFLQLRGTYTNNGGEKRYTNQIGMKSRLVSLFSTRAALTYICAHAQLYILRKKEYFLFFFPFAGSPFNVHNEKNVKGAKKDKSHIDIFQA